MGVANLPPPSSSYPQIYSVPENGAVSPTTGEASDGFSALINAAPAVVPIGSALSVSADAVVCVATPVPLSEMVCGVVERSVVSEKVDFLLPAEGGVTDLFALLLQFPVCCINPTDQDVLCV